MAYLLDDLVTMIRQYTDEPAAKAKYSTTDLLRMSEDAFYHVLGEVMICQDNPLIVRHTFSVAEGSTSFMLPPNVGTVLKVGERDTTTNEINYVLHPRHPQSWRGPGFVLEGKSLRFDPPWANEAVDLELWYLPNGDFKLHYGTGTSPTSTSLTLVSNPTLGTLDTRANAYVGAILRIVSDTNGYVQERPITAYANTTRVATVSPAFDPTPAGTVLYEIVPSWIDQVKDLVALYVAIRLCAAQEKTVRYQLLSGQYKTALRNVRLQQSRIQSIVGHGLNRGVYSPRYGRV